MLVVAVAFPSTASTEMSPKLVDSDTDRTLPSIRMSPTCELAVTAPRTSSTKMSRWAVCTETLAAAGTERSIEPNVESHSTAAWEGFPFGTTRTTRSSPFFSSFTSNSSGMLALSRTSFLAWPVTLMLVLVARKTSPWAATAVVLLGQRDVEVAVGGDEREEQERGLQHDRSF